jgi:hypothetical protein
MSAILCLAVAAILPQRIVPNRIVYAEDEKGWADIVFTNAAESAASADYVVTDSWDIAGECREICRGTASLGPYAVKTIRIAWPGSTVRYGHELRVWTDAGTRSEYFAVNTDWWRVCQVGGLDTIHTKLTPLFRQFMEYYGLPVCETKNTAGDRLWMDACRHEGFGMGPFPGYWTLMTRWQMQKCSVGGNMAAADMPDGVRWFTPNGPEMRDSGRIREDARYSHTWGLRHTYFTIGNMEGPLGLEIARKHPEYILRTSRGQFAGIYHDKATNPEQLSNLDNGKRSPWTYLSPNFNRDDVVEWALKDLADAVEAFGVDGVYWDGQYVPFAGYDQRGRKLPNFAEPEALPRQEKTWKRWHELILDRHPDHFAWGNLGSADPSRRHPSFEHPRFGTLTEIQWPFLLNPAMPCSTYRGLLDRLLPARDSRYLGYSDGTKPSKIHLVGYLYPSFNYSRKENPGEYREVWTMAQHVMAILASTLGHPVAGGPQVRNFKQMMMRYAEFFWHEDIEVMEDGYQKFVCDSLREVWYDDMIYRREFKDHTDYYIHLVNVPESERCREDVEVDPPEVDDAEVSTKLFGAEGVKAWAIQPYGYLDPVLEPRQQEVAVKRAKGETVFAVPPFTYYVLLVIRVPKAACGQSISSIQQGTKP